VKITILCVGHLGATPEGKLALEWASRAGLSGRSHGLGPVDIVEVEPRRPGKVSEGDSILKRLADAHVIACDERGESRTSRQFTEWLGRRRDDGVRRLMFVIGGADGLDERVRAASHSRLAFGPQTWPHALVRAMLAEQIYRAATLMAGSPYHRD
jgi:23S rRNA (pseudouridine1915-N3)-methyltransferase